MCVCVCVFWGPCSKRHNLFPPDFAVIRLHGGSLLRGVNIDTAHFDGNHGQAASLEGVVLRGLELWNGGIVCMTRGVGGC